MYKVVSTAIAGAGRYAQFIADEIVYHHLIACQEPPTVVVGAKPVGISPQYLERIV